jgi:ketosteroid isomerase-like protein
MQAFYTEAILISKQNVEIVRGIYDAFAQRDSEMPFGLYAADIEWDMTATLVVGSNTVYYGHDGVRALFRDVLVEFGEFEFQALDLTPYGNHVLVTVGEHGVGRRSRVAVDRRHYALWTLREGLVTRVRTFLDHGEALQAAGLSE